MAAGEKVKIVIRADGNADIGVGHLMRCLTIAEQVGEDDRVVFWCADETSAALVQARGFAALVLGTDYRDMPSELPRLKQMGDTVGEMQAEEKSEHKQVPQIILVDSYFVTVEYLQALGAYGRVYLLEDMPGHKWPVDGVINYNAFADLHAYELIYQQSREIIPGSDVEQDVKLYIGASYVPIRPQFVGCDYQVRGQVKEILVTTGGGDRENIAGEILERMEGMAYRIHVVSGPYNPHGAWLASYVQSHPQVVVHQRVEEMAKLMLQCDLAVTAGGTTVYELCALGVPFVCFSYAENQEALTEFAGRQEIGLNAGKYHQNPTGTLDNIGNMVRWAAADQQLRQLMSRKARGLVDGHGARRLAEGLVAKRREVPGPAGRY